MSELPLLQRLNDLNEHELRRLLTEQLTRQKLGLYWERDAIAHDQALNADVVLPRLLPEASHTPDGCPQHANLIIEGDNFDALRLLRATHAGKIRVIYIDPPYNTGNKDWVYNDQYVGQNDRWRHSQWLEFLYQRLTLARDLLTSDGVILVSINDENRARLELLMDEVFPGRRVGSFVWRSRTGGNDTKGALLSDNHEHVLIYANEGFSFQGDSRDEEAFSNPDADPRGPWANDNLVKAHNAKQRPEAYYHIQNPDTGIWYLCDPDSVWRFSSTTRPLKKRLQADPIETIIEQQRLLWPGNDQVALYGSVAEIWRAIENGTAPKQLKIYAQLDELQLAAATDAKVARLLSYVDPIETWVGRTIGYGKPRYKRFRSQLKRDVTPLSSWLNPAADGVQVFDDDDITLTVGATAEGTTLYKKLLGNKDFPYPKPLSLIKNLLAQASRPGDTVLDFFAGSGTTGQAVLELNAEDGAGPAPRRFILCSSTEATAKEPVKNLCRDVCAERLRRVIAGYGGKPGHTLAQGGEFAYLQLDKFDGADVLLDATAQHAATLLSMRNMATAPVEQAQSAITVVAQQADWLLVLCQDTEAPTLAALRDLHQQHPQARLSVVTPRPKALALWLAEQGIAAHTQALHEVLTLGQGGRRIQQNA